MNVASSDILSLQWLEHQNIFSQAIIDLRNKSSFTDATLACEGKFYPVHKFVLSTCSEYFNAIFEWTPCVNPVIVINNISTHHLESLLDFMYRGETSVQECHIQDVMKAAECLHIKGLSLRPEDLNFAKNKIKSTDLEEQEPKKKRRKSENIKKTFLKPQLQSDCFYGNQVSSPLHSSISSTRPTPTPPLTPVHHSSPHHTPPIHSPLHSASPHALSSTPSPISQNHFQNATPYMVTSKSQVLPVTYYNNNNNNSNNNNNNNSSNNANQHARNVTHLKESSSTTLSSYIQNIPMQHSQHIASFTTQPRDQYAVKTEQTNLVYSSLPNAISSSIAHSDLIPSSQESQQYRKYSNMMSRLQQGISQEAITVALPLLSQVPVEQKLISIGEDLNLGSVKELEISAEDGGAVSLPEMLEDFVGMRQLYDSKVDTHEETKSSLDNIPQVSSDLDSSTNVSHFEQESNESMYEFKEELHEESDIGKMKLLKEKRVKVYSNNGTQIRKRDSSEMTDITHTLLSSKSSSSNPSAAVSGPSLLHPSPENKKEVKSSFVCGTCNRIYKKKDSLTRHMRTHTEYPYTCTVCLHKCKAYKDYIQHRKTHADKRCDKCDFVTIRNDALRRHMSTHSEEKSHKCPYSSCAFTACKANQLTSHVQNHHFNKSENVMATSLVSTSLAVPITPSPTINAPEASSTVVSVPDISVNPEASPITSLSSDASSCSVAPVSTVAPVAFQSEHQIEKLNDE